LWAGDDKWPSGSFSVKQLAIWLDFVGRFKDYVGKPVVLWASCPHIAYKSFVGNIEAKPAQVNIRWDKQNGCNPKKNGDLRRPNLVAGTGFEPATFGL
jgi:hypothetical protein